MSRAYSDGKQRRSAKYRAVLDDLRGISPAKHLKAIVALPEFTITTSSDTDRITRHRTRSMDWKRHGE
jgi:hypothetical protein